MPDKEEKIVVVIGHFPLAGESFRKLMELMKEAPGTKVIGAEDVGIDIGCGLSVPSVNAGELRMLKNVAMQLPMLRSISEKTVMEELEEERDGQLIHVDNISGVKSDKTLEILEAGDLCPECSRQLEIVDGKPNCGNQECYWFTNPCPDCGKQLIGGDNWSGVKCPDTECGYWFCL